MSEPDSIVVSIKPTGKYDSALLVFKGSTGADIQRRLGAFFGDAVTVAGETPWQTFVRAEQLAQNGVVTQPIQRQFSPNPEPPSTVSENDGQANVETGLGATVSHEEPPVAQSAPAAEPQPEAPKADPKAELIEKIGQATSMGELGKLFTQNRSLWTDPDVDKAAEKRSKELS